MRTQALEWRIRTPEGIVFAYNLAGPVSRALAWAIDAACLLVAANILRSILAPLHALSPDIAMAITGLSIAAASMGYAILLEWFWRGQTLGKRLLGLKVQDASGLRLRFSQILVRNLFRAVDILPALYLVGVAAILCSRRAQRLGDLAGNTIVIRIAHPVRPDLSRLEAPMYNSLRDSPVIAARFRQRVTPREAALALQALVRRDQLDHAARIEVFGELARYFRELVAVPNDLLRGVSDEQFIRNVADVLYRARQETKEPHRATLEKPTRP